MGEKIKKKEIKEKETKEKEIKENKGKRMLALVTETSLLSSLKLCTSVPEK